MTGSDGDLQSTEALREVLQGLQRSHEALKAGSAQTQRLLDALEAPARRVAGGAAPRVVLLTPGPYSETYYEHAYLARYLGLH